MNQPLQAVRIFAISGSLRTASSNTALLRAARSLAPDGVEIHLYDGLGGLPHFNPDLEGEEPPAVLDFRARLREADGVLISTPEYAHGVPGVLKDALDWVVSSGELVNKPVALLRASALATYAHASLTETLTVMGGCVVAEERMTVALASNRIDEGGIVSHPEMSSAVRAALALFGEAIRDSRSAAAA